MIRNFIQRFYDQLSGLYTTINDLLFSFFCPSAFGKICTGKMNNSIGFLYGFSIYFLLLWIPFSVGDVFILLFSFICIPCKNNYLVILCNQCFCQSGAYHSSASCYYC